MRRLFRLTPSRAALLTGLLVMFAMTAAQAAATPSALTPSQDDTPILTLHSDNERRSVSRAEIESSPLYEVTLQHFEGIQGSFAGVWLDDFLDAQGLGDAGTLRFIAHDDYTVFLSPEDRDARRYLLATRLDGEPLTLTEFGPSMLIVPADAEAVEAGTASMTHWIWSIRDILAQ
ncbi:hypothetical protein HOP52_00800 [Halomonas campisalis]|uniref:Oxidoreductase molybdopterin-binding domain-containing protein n=1 Tax=Billgrantia campisalis TaxID=74661 RepID=A0ABS9P3F4_9GAMM|nr:hypothetical protein [Halomonas campisalis]MCG6656316.1 hypothetical protein [Halomonas campisalis]MDR5861502.1 hypothetical protein [Halomonas campisalis]